MRYIFEIKSFISKYLLGFILLRKIFTFTEMCRVFNDLFWFYLPLQNNITMNAIKTKHRLGLPDDLLATIFKKIYNIIY